ncbi:hypothetical protein [Streptomyces sp. ME01-18h]|uniref:hypothetical protein n=1 Tax=Streptomyces sp. ME01-18h TaxID=462920 RepID=UPI0029ABE742|nr:hypothetical protein [Streptomyces sp. ME01-18h]MDX3398385.1 hypothetical protein [Streptomyces sp. ME01-18h]
MPEDCSTATVRKAVRAQLCFSDELPPGVGEFELPPGRMLMEVELVDLTLVILRPGSMDRRLFDEYNRYLDRVTSQGNWSRDPSRAGLLHALTSAGGR